MENLKSKTLDDLKNLTLITPETIDLIITTIKKSNLKNKELNDFLKKVYFSFENSNRNIECKGIFISELLSKLNKMDIKMNSEIYNNFKNLMIQSNKKIKFKNIKTEIKITDVEKENLIKPLKKLNFEDSINYYLAQFFKEIKEIRLKEPSKELIPYLGITDKNGNYIRSTLKDSKIKKILIIISIYYDFILEFLIKNSNMKSIHRMIDESNLLTSTDKEIFKLSFSYYQEQKYIEFLHLSVPRIENLFRNIINKNIKNGNSSLLGNKRSYGFDYKILNKLLDDPIIKNIFSEDCIFIFKFILTDSKGFNLRNRLSHGLIESNELCKPHSILTISLLIFLIDSKL